MSDTRHSTTAPTSARFLAPGELIGAHSHDEHQLIYAARGVLAVTTDAGTWVVPASRAIWVPAGVVHAHRAHGAIRLHLVGVPRDEDPLGITHPTVVPVGALLRELITAYTAFPTREHDEARRMRAVLLDRVRAAPLEPVHRPTPSDPRLRAVCAILEADVADGRTLAELGAQVGAGARTLSRLFDVEFGMSFPQWRTQLRLYHALVLLAEGVPVTVVAYRCGCSSPSAFIDVYRRAFGVTPGSHARADAGR